MINKQWILKSFPRGDIADTDLVLEESNLREIGEQEILIRNIYLSLDPANRGWMSGQASYVDAMKIGDVMRGGTIGIIEKSNNEKFQVGDYVNSMGGWQNYSISSGKGVQKIPQNTGFELSAFMSVMGMTGMTAYFGLLDITNPQEGETLVVSAAAGAVGSIVCQIGKIKGCRVIGIAGSDEKCDWLKNELNVDYVFNYKKTDNLVLRLKEIMPDGFDLYFDNVGGDFLEAAIFRMKNYGRIVICGRISQMNSTKTHEGLKNIAHVLVKRLTIKGFLIFDHENESESFQNDMSEWLKNKKIVSKETIYEGLSKAPKAFVDLLNGKNIGKMLVKI